MLVSLLVWIRSLGIVAAESGATPAAELYYWITITFSQTPGTALGDWVTDAGAGYAGGG